MFFFCEVSRDRPFVLLKGEEPRRTFSESDLGSPSPVVLSLLLFECCSEVKKTAHTQLS